MSEPDALKPLAGVDGQPVFEEAWQAQALAIADSLVQNGVFSAGEWSQTLGDELAAAAVEGAIDNQDTYYKCVLNALENLVVDHSQIGRAAIRDKRKDWEQAYLSTPHGQPVELKSGD